MSRPPLARWLDKCAVVTAVTGASMWLAGLLLADRFWWSQWLSWIPAPLVAVAASAAALLAWLVGRAGWRARRWAMSAIAIAAIAWTVHTDVGLGAGPSGTSPGIRVLQWNTDWPSGDDPRSEAALADHPADFVLISNRGSITAQKRVQAWAGADARVYGAGPFAIVTRWPVMEATQVATGGQGRQLWWVARFTVVPPGWQGRPLRIAMVDLPSRPSLARAMVAEGVRKACEQGGLGEVDLVAGDFNAIEGSVVLSRCFGDMRDALTEAGHGWLATWPRVLPLWRIDHVLISRRLEARSGWTIDPGVSHHRMTMAVIAERR